MLGQLTIEKRGALALQRRALLDLKSPAADPPRCRSHSDWSHPPTAAALAALPAEAEAVVPNGCPRLWLPPAKSSHPSWPKNSDCPCGVRDQRTQRQPVTFFAACFAACHSAYPTNSKVTIPVARPLPACRPAPTAPHRLLRPGEDMQPSRRLGIPQPHRLIVASREQQLAIRAVAERHHRPLVFRAAAAPNSSPVFWSPQQDCAHRRCPRRQSVRRDSSPATAPHVA
jgi:hypothetical protein